MQFRGDNVHDPIDDQAALPVLVGVDHDLESSLSIAAAAVVPNTSTNLTNGRIAPRYWITSRPSTYSIADRETLSSRATIDVGMANRRASPKSTTSSVSNALLAFESSASE